jgi:DNA polymerase IV
VRTACVYIPRFACAVETLRNPRLARRPLIVGDAEQPKHVLDCSGGAEAQSVRRGMTVRKALGLCPDAVVLPPDPVLYRAKWEAVRATVDAVAQTPVTPQAANGYLEAVGTAPISEPSRHGRLAHRPRPW